MQPIKTGLCRVCGEVALVGVIFLSQLGPERPHETVHVSHPDHTPEPWPYRPAGERFLTSVGSNSAPTGVMANAPTYEVPSLRIVWPTDDDV